MVYYYIPGWHRPAPPAGHAVLSGSSFGDNILAVAFGALALIAANAFDRTNPALATVLRCTVGGVGLIWLFSRCCTSIFDGTDPADLPPYIPPVHPASTRRTYSDYYSPPTYTRTTYHATHVHPAPAPGGFPAVYRADAQPDPTPMYEVPNTRGGFPTVYPATASTTTTTHTYVPDPHPPKTAHTTYSHAAAHAPGGFSTAYPGTSATGTTRTHTYVKPTSIPTHHHAASPRTAFTAAPSAPGAFPTVYRATAQPDPTSMHRVPETR